jgi:predicted RNA-binding protein with PUA-like domain
MSKRYWLMKSEADSYGWDRLVKDGGTVWDGVRNHTAKLNLQAMKAGEQAFFYHSVTGKEIVGIVEITRAGMADPKDDTGTWAAVEIKPLHKLQRPVTLAAIKADPALKDIELVRQSRLSVAEIRPEEWARILEMANA